MQRRKIWVGLLIGLLVLIGVAAMALFFWVGNPQTAMEIAEISLESDEQVRVVREPWLSFMPQDSDPEVGFIIYPGGLVVPEAYAPTARAIAEQGYLVVITPMPLNLAVLNVNEAADVMLAYPEIDHWAIGGHSLGGSMAAAFADQNEDVAGLVFWASYPADSNDLSGQAIAVSSIYGTLDGLATPEDVLAAKPLLPEDTVWVPIEGGNHAQFGWYGPQDGDNPATISQQEQQEQVIAATIALLAQLE
jgi:dienelactone hydrolase